MRVLLSSLLLVACEEDALMTGDAGDAGRDAGDSGAAMDAAPVDMGVEDMGVEDSGPPPPSMLRVSGEAMGVAPGGEAAECSFFADIFELRFAGDGSWTGTILGGEVIRTITPTTAQNAYEFSALIGGPASADRRGDLLDVHIAGDQPPDALPFWRELETITGTITADFEAEGSWSCAPLDLREPGFVDFMVDAPGTWRVQPTP